MLKTNLPLLLIILCPDAWAQNFSYTNYSIREGLAGSNVYAAIQDKEGFMWFATETGVSRFDGTHFKNFTIDDGLPDNEILNFFSDSKGRLWMMPFRKTICYYYKGKLYTQKNDSLLRRLKITGNIFGMAEDKEGNLALIEAYGIYFIQDTIVKRFDLDPSYFVAIATNTSGGINVFADNGFFSVTKGGLTALDKNIGIYVLGQIFMDRTFFVHEKDKKISLTFYAGKKHSFGISHTHLNFSILNGGYFSDNTADGTFIYNSNDCAFKEHHLPGKTIANVFKDNENNLWFCTQREGIYKLNSPFVSNRVFKSAHGKTLSIHSLAKYKNKLWIGTEEAYLFTLTLASARINKETYTAELMGQPRTQIRTLLENNKDLLLGAQNKIFSTFSGKTRAEGSLKDVRPAFNNQVLICTSSGAWLANTDSLPTTSMTLDNTIWKGRTTTAHYSNDTFYIGTLDGLHKLSRADGKKLFAGDDDPLLKTRIAAIRETPDGILWIATYDKGIVAYKNKKVIANISKEQGLSSNICRTLFLHGNNLWVGTDNGLNKIKLDGNKYAITQYSVADGLLSNFINAVCADDSLVYVGTPDGVSYFDDKKISQQAPCLLRLTGITVSGNSIAQDIHPITLKRRYNNIRFEYAGISYRSGGEIFYRYRLMGLDTSWQTTKENFLSYPTLMPKNYKMELQAVNKFGISSEVIRIPFSIERYWWEIGWVQIAGIILSLLLVIFVMNRRIKKVRQREKEKNSLREKVSSLEQMALRAQMNPHFIFNSLNSIQHYVVDKDVVGANKYIASFSRLIRLTLDNSSKAEISLEEEIKYLSEYLELEKMRTGNKFSYSIKVPGEMVYNNFTISPMILQPFVENSIRHGIRYRNDSNGEIRIEIQEYKKGLKFIIEDNGVGRSIADMYKSKNPIEYQSKGISLTEERISIMNKSRKDKIEFTVTDINNNGTIEGTRVVINYPNHNTNTI